jgi:hypothetical protein
VLALVAIVAIVTPLLILITLLDIFLIVFRLGSVNLVSNSGWVNLRLIGLGTKVAVGLWVNALLIPLVQVRDRHRRRERRGGRQDVHETHDCGKELILSTKDKEDVTSEQ